VSISCGNAYQPNGQAQTKPKNHQPTSQQQPTNQESTTNQTIKQLPINVPASLVATLVFLQVAACCMTLPNHHFQLKLSFN